MSANYCCRLCQISSREYKNLYDINGQSNNVYDIALTYFHPLFLKVQREAKYMPVICMICWRNILSFHKFQQSVFFVQAKLLEQENLLAQMSKDYNPSNINRTEGIGHRNGIQAFGIAPNGEEDASLNLPDLNLMNVYPGHPSDSPIIQQFHETEAVETSNDDGNPIVRAIKMSPHGGDSDNENTVGDIEDDEPMGYFTGGEMAQEEMVMRPDPQTIDIFPFDKDKELEIKKENVTEDTCYIDNPNSPTTSLEGNGKSAIKRKRRSTHEVDVTIAEWRPQLQCCVCHRIYHSFPILQTHFRAQHPNEEFHISCCKQTFRQEFQIEEHIHHQHRKPTPPNQRNAMPREDPSYMVRPHQLMQEQILQHNHISKKINLNHERLPTTPTPPPLLHGDGNDHSLNVPTPTTHQTQNVIDKLIAQWKPQLQCDFCQQSFSSFTLLQQHLQQKHPLVCCHRNFNSRSDLMRHKQVCHGTETSTSPSRNEKQLQELDEFIAKWNSKLACEICRKCYTTFTQLQEHFRQNHPTEQCHIVCCQRKLNLRCKIVEHIILDHQPVLM